MTDTTLDKPIADILAAMDEGYSSYDAPYVLMSRDTGKDVTELQHLILSLTDLFTTALGSVPTLREYGCALWEYIDQPMNSDNVLDMRYAIHEAVHRWEVRFLIKFTEIRSTDVPGELELDLYGWYLLEGRGVILRNVRLDFKKELHLSNS